MVRSIFFAFGLFVTIWGASLLMVDKVVLAIHEEPEQGANFRGMLGNDEQQKVFAPPTWLPFNLMSVGAVTMLYSVMLKRNK